VKDDGVYLLHILDAIRQIDEYTAPGEEWFFSDRKTQDAVMRNLEIIGEAVKKLSPSLKGAYPEIPWKRISGMRDKLIHEYFGVDLRLVFEAVRTDIPKLERAIRCASGQGFIKGVQLAELGFAPLWPQLHAGYKAIHRIHDRNWQLQPLLLQSPNKMVLPLANRMGRHQRGFFLQFDRHLWRPSEQTTEASI
jgi:uncharacterized protein with HEPN domain